MFDKNRAPKVKKSNKSKASDVGHNGFLTIWTSLLDYFSGLSGNKRSKLANDIIEIDNNGLDDESSTIEIVTTGN